MSICKNNITLLSWVSWSVLGVPQQNHISSSLLVCVVCVSIRFRLFSVWSCFVFHDTSIKRYFSTFSSPIVQHYRISNIPTVSIKMFLHTVRLSSFIARHSNQCLFWLHRSGLQLHFQIMQSYINAIAILPNILYSLILSFAIIPKIPNPSPLRLQIMIITSQLFVSDKSLISFCLIKVFCHKPSKEKENS